MRLRCDHVPVMRDAARGIDDVAEALVALHDDWLRRGASQDALDWISELTTRLGWWSGRLSESSRSDRGRVRTSGACERGR
jgi:hypothetical protein